VILTLQRGTATKCKTAGGQFFSLFRGKILNRQRFNLNFNTRGTIKELLYSVKNQSILEFLAYKKIDKNKFILEGHI